MCESDDFPLVTAKLKVHPTLVSFKRWDFLILIRKEAECVNRLRSLSVEGTGQIT